MTHILDAIYARQTSGAQILYPHFLSNVNVPIYYHSAKINRMIFYLSEWTMFQTVNTIHFQNRFNWYLTNEWNWQMHFHWIWLSAKKIWQSIWNYLRNIFEIRIAPTEKRQEKNDAFHSVPTTYIRFELLPYSLDNIFWLFFFRPIAMNTCRKKTSSV